MAAGELYDRAYRFVLAEGRLLERRVMAALFEGADPAGALLALAAYRNDDGGFGHGLEPDKRSPSSQPLDVETAFRTMEALRSVDGELVRGACDFLAHLGPGVGCLTADALSGPRAPHWGEWALAPSLNPTAGLVAHLWRWGVEHPWRDAATAFCWTQLEGGLPTDAHAFGEVLAFLDAVPERDRASELIGEARGALATLELFHLDPAAPGYALTPLHYATARDSRWCELFDDGVLDGHLDALAGMQADDGGWPISWETVGPAATGEWRGIVTLVAMRTLRAFGRLR